MAGPLFPDLVPDPEDKSLHYLSLIFGKVGNVLGGETGGMVSSLFFSLNTIALTVGAIIVVYTTIVGMMKTAAEGEFLGKSWSSLWVPIRMVAGVAGLFPASSGYSIIQVVVMWIIVQGVGAADLLWKNAVKSAMGMSAVAYASNATSETSAMGADSAFKSLFQGLVCQETSKMMIIGRLPNEIAFARNTQSNDFSPTSNTDKYAMGPGGACGTLTKCNPVTSCAGDLAGTRACNICIRQNETLAKIIKYFSGLAEVFAAADKEYITFYYFANSLLNPGYQATGWIKEYCDKNSLSITSLNATCCVPPTIPAPAPIPQYCAVGDSTVAPRNFPPPYRKADVGPSGAANGMSLGTTDSELEWAMRWVLLPLVTKTAAPVDIPTLDTANSFIAINSKMYTTALTAAADTGKLPVQNDGDFDPNNAIKFGWITAGSYFYQLVNLAAQSLNKTQMPLSVSQPSDEVLQGKYRTNYLAANDFLKVIASKVETGPGGALPGTAGSEYDTALRDINGTLSASWMNMMRGVGASNPGIHDTPLLRVATFGQNLLIIAQVFYVIMVAAGAIFTGLAAIGEFIGIGVGNFTIAMQVYKAIQSMLYPALFILLGALMTMGALLGMYVPMIPFVVFTASVIGWFIAAIEAMVAAPIIALGILSPGGQSEVFGRAENSLMILFNLFLRPSLMIVGLLIASYLADVVIRFICMGFQLAMKDVMTQLPGLVEEMIFIAIFTSLVFTSMNQVFTLIHHIPERILTYIGGQAQQFGEGQAAQAMKGAVEGAAGGAAGAGKSSSEGAGKAAGDLAAEKQATANAGGAGTSVKGMHIVPAAPGPPPEQK